MSLPIFLTIHYYARQIIITTAHCQCNNPHLVQMLTPDRSSLTFDIAFFILTARSLYGWRWPKGCLIARVAQWKRNRLVIGRLVGSTPLSGFDFRARLGGVPEWTIGADCKSAACRLRRFESYPLHHLG